MRGSSTSQVMSVQCLKTIELCCDQDYLVATAPHGKSTGRHSTAQDWNTCSWSPSSPTSLPRTGWGLTSWWSSTSAPTTTSLRTTLSLSLICFQTQEILQSNSNFLPSFIFWQLLCFYIIWKWILSLKGSYYGNYKFINEVVSRGSRVFSYILTHRGEFSYTDSIGEAETSWNTQKKSAFFRNPQLWSQPCWWSLVSVESFDADLLWSERLVLAQL